MTFADAIITSLQAAASYESADATPPVCIIWTDEGRQWQALVTRLRECGMPIICFGQYDPANRTGPALWIRCMVDHALPEADWPIDACPIVYLPGISRQQLRAVDDSPDECKPIAELQYRGVFWSHPNGRDWTIGGFLQSNNGGLDIPVASDAATAEAMARALPILADEPIESLRASAPLTSAKFNALVSPDKARNMLLWLNDPAGLKGVVKRPEWEAFRDICQSEFGFDPDSDGPIYAAQKFGGQDGPWKIVWNRFAEAPARYPGIPKLLRQAKPVGDNLFSEPSSWPQDNDAAEESLRQNLNAVSGLSVLAARQRVFDLWREHRDRRDWVWSQLGQSPLAEAMKSVESLAHSTARSDKRTGSSPTLLSRNFFHSAVLNSARRLVSV
jgi:hypothetical protein